MRTLLELRAGEDLLRVAPRARQPRATDHRLRAWFPLPEPAATSVAESVFGTVERGLTAEGGPNELGLPTFPSRRFVQAGGLTVAHDGLLEYELVDVAGRAAPGSSPSRSSAAPGSSRRARWPTDRCRPARRSRPADAQMPGRQVLEYVLATSGRDPFAVADDAFVPLIRARTRRGVAGLAGLGTITPPIAAGRGRRVGRPGHARSPSPAPRCRR